MPRLTLDNQHSGGHHRGWTNQFIASEFARQIRARRVTGRKFIRRQMPRMSPAVHKFTSTHGEHSSAFMNTLAYPPGPKGRLFGLGLHLASQRDPLGFMERLAREYGDIVHFKIGRRHVYLLNHPDHIKDVLVSHYANFLKGRGIVRRDNFLGEGLLTSEGDFHRRQRQLTQPAFHHERFAGYGAMMAKLAADVSRTWRAGDRLDVLEAMRQITLPIASQTLFGTDVETEHERIIAAFRTGLSRFRSFKPAATRLSDRFSLVHRRRLQTRAVSTRDAHLADHRGAPPRGRRPGRPAVAAAVENGRRRRTVHERPADS